MHPCYSLAAVELNPQALSKNGTADPYVSVTLSPKNILYETNVERQNNDPMFQNVSMTDWQSERQIDYPTFQSKVTIVDEKQNNDSISQNVNL